MQSSDNTNNKKNLKRSRSFPRDMTVTDTTVPHNLDDCILFPVEEIVQYPLPGYVAPTSISFSPDDTMITYLFSSDHTLNRKLFSFNLNNLKQDLLFSPPDGGLEESNISPEEKLRRERLRERGLGVTRYEWVKTSPRKRVIMVPLPAGIYFQDLSCSEPELKLPSSPSSPIIDPHLSPDGTMLAYVRDSELHALNLLYDEVKQLTFGANGSSITHGLAEYIAQEEMDRKNGYWWSPDSKFIAFTEVDSSKVPLFRIMHQGKSSVGPEAQEDHAYPFAGASNVKVSLGVVPVSGGPVTWMDLLCGGAEDHRGSDEEYLARVCWIQGNVLVAQVLNRSHTKLKILRFDIKTGKSRVVLVEEHETWINLHDCFTPLDRGVARFSGGFIWASECTGYRHLYLHDASGARLGPITRGDWMVEQIAGVNEAAGFVYFTGTVDGPLDSNLYCTKLHVDNGNPTPLVRLTRGKGKHVVMLDHHMRNFVDIHDSLDSPPRVSLCSLHDGSVIVPLYEQPVTVPRFKRLHLEPPEIFQISANDGTVLYGALYKPDSAKFGPPPYRTVISVYGGPGVQLVCNSWVNTVDMRAQYLRSKGVLVWKLDNRGTSRRGLHFEGALKHKFGETDVADQLSGADWLISRGLSEPGRIGLCGWSYGGYLSAMALAKHPETFRCAVAGAPVTSWDGYDTFYTEKYMGLPSENEAGYERGSVTSHVGEMKGKLLIVHGMIDENVHFRHSARLVNALVAARKSYELLVFPDERHMPRQHRDRIYMEERIWEFLDRNL